jgi:phage/plasmid-associated DNA primase
MLHDIGELTVKLSRQILQSVPGSSGAARSRALENTGTCTLVRYVLQNRPAMIVREKEFDADPRLLNTPKFVINLETGDTYAHSPHFMMQQQTLVTADLVAYGSSYRLGCPRFMNFLELIADGRGTVRKQRLSSVLFWMRLRCASRTLSCRPRLS